MSHKAFHVFLIVGLAIAIVFIVVGMYTENNGSKKGEEETNDKRTVIPEDAEGSNMETATVVILSKETVYKMVVPLEQVSIHRPANMEEAVAKIQEFQERRFGQGRISLIPVSEAFVWMNKRGGE